MAAKGWWKAAWTRGIRRTLLLSAVILLLSAVILILVAAAAAAAAAATVVVDNRRRPPGVALMVKTDQHRIQRLIEEWRVQGREESRRWQTSLLPHRISGSGGGGGRDFKSKKRQLIGSWPPTCRAKCGGCAPCLAVHVPIQPGRSSPLEYYPEAWRCKCRNRLFLP